MFDEPRELFAVATAGTVALSSHARAVQTPSSRSESPDVRVVDLGGVVLGNGAPKTIVSMPARSREPLLQGAAAQHALGVGLR